LQDGPVELGSGKKKDHANSAVPFEGPASAYRQVRGRRSYLN
jgi:hypothetical protein